MRLLELNFIFFRESLLLLLRVAAHLEHLGTQLGELLVGLAVTPLQLSARITTHTAHLGA